jgi:hypothetical protein
MELSKANQKILEAYNLGYRIINEIIFNPKGNILKGNIPNKKQKYRRFNIKSTQIFVHRFVAYQKFGDKIFNENLEVRHLDGNSLNNKEENIEIGTHSENMMDQSLERRLEKAVKASRVNRRFSNETILEIKEKHKNGKSYNELMREYNISSKGTIGHIIRNNYVT